MIFNQHESSDMKVPDTSTWLVTIAADSGWCFRRIRSFLLYTLLLIENMPSFLWNSLHTKSYPNVSVGIFVRNQTLKKNVCFIPRDWHLSRTGFNAADIRDELLHFIQPIIFNDRILHTHHKISEISCLQVHKLMLASITTPFFNSRESIPCES